ncbi:hypothetical protein HYALB_00000829 [Hymenoscyphus albidus]|uniref:Uncharacterized protein n=1 Tax=Hymenoscyphus albidus TaxID=595503 RepID=A0A9N9L979_9HELO|nr:hypothetical protein HYALB_00000829 [Hymenoscyphus albidus]
MKFVIFMLGIVAATPIDHDRRDNFNPAGMLWCDSGTEGNGGCEANGLSTFCCRGEFEAPGYVIQRNTTVFSRNKSSSPFCTAPGGKVIDGGQIVCAPNGASTQ